MSLRHYLANRFLGQDQVGQDEDGIPADYIEVQEKHVDFVKNTHERLVYKQQRQDSTGNSIMIVPDIA